MIWVSQHAGRTAITTPLWLAIIGWTFTGLTLLALAAVVATLAIVAVATMGLAGMVVATWRRIKR